MTLVPLRDVQNSVLSLAESTKTESVNIIDALNLYSAQDIFSKINIPSFNNSQMDGYAIRITKDTQFPLTLKLDGTIFAGQSTNRQVSSNKAIRIFTGAKVPKGTNAVVMQEFCTLTDNGNKVTVLNPVNIGDNIRPIADDIKIGQQILKIGELITPTKIGLLASCGIQKLKINKRLCVGVLSTGSELTDVGEKLLPAKIYDSNRLTLLSLCKNLNLNVIDFGIAYDTMDGIIKNLSSMSKKADIIIVTGGVSVGDADFVKTAIKKLCPKNSKSLQIAIKPAKPFAFGKNSSSIFFGLPGNPVSALVSFELLVKPVINKMMGNPKYLPQYIKIKSLQDFEYHDDGKIHYLRIKVNKDKFGNLIASPVKKQGSHNLFWLVNSNALAEIKNKATIKKGDYFKAIQTGEIL